MHVNYYAYFDGPENYKKRFSYYSWGGNPQLLSKLGWFLRNNKHKLQEIWISFYLFNNYHLHRYFKILAKRGVKINVISIPLEGYDNSKPKSISEHNTKSRPYYKTPVTQYNAAHLVYSDVLKELTGNYKLFVCPHMFIRSPYVRPFSRGAIPYSLHIKNGYFQYKDGSGAVFLSSSNLAVRDLVKEENLLIIEGDEGLNIQTKTYFLHLLKNSIAINKFDPHRNYFNYQIETCPPYTTSDNVITAPFYRKSPVLAEKKIKNLVNQASKRIYISGQHISAYKYSLKEEYLSGNKTHTKVDKTGFLFDVIQRAVDGIKVKILSQTFVDETGNSHNCRKPGNIKAFQEFSAACSNHPNIELFVNEDVHNKFIIIDDLLIVSTFNYTPTQFMYLPFVEIDSFKNIPNLKYKGIFSEIGQMVVIRNAEVVEQYRQRFKVICASKQTYQHQ